MCSSALANSNLFFSVWQTPLRDCDYSFKQSLYVRLVIFAGQQKIRNIKWCLEFLNELPHWPFHLMIGISAIIKLAQGRELLLVTGCYKSNKCQWKSTDWHSLWHSNFKTFWGAISGVKTYLSISLSTDRPTISRCLRFDSSATYFKTILSSFAVAFFCNVDKLLSYFFTISKTFFISHLDSPPVLL